MKEHKLIPDPPPGSELWSPISHAKWQEVITFLRSEGRYLEIANSAIAQYCYDHTLIEHAMNSLDADGIFVADRQGGTKKNPAMTLIEQVRKRMKDFEVQFGITPLSRHRMAIKNAKDEVERKRVSMRRSMP